MDDCCSPEKSEGLSRLQGRQARTLRAVLVINAVMFGIEFTSGLLAGSVALVADSLDMLTDALVYAFSLYVISRGDVWKARAAVIKAAVMGWFGLFVVGHVIYRLVYPTLPSVEGMGLVGCIALAANLWCFTLLVKHCAEDINMRSAWVCSRNDVASNLGVLVATVAVWTTGSPWPDVIVGGLIAGIFLRSAISIVRDARMLLHLHGAKT